MKKLLVLTIGLMIAVSAASAIPITFASVQYLGGSGSNVTYEWRNTASGFLGLETGLGSSAASIPVDFMFQNVSVPSALQGHLNAHITISAPPTANVASAFSQRFQPLGGTITITLDNPYLGQNLLLAT